MSDEQLNRIANQLAEIDQDLLGQFLAAKDKNKWLEDNASKLEGYSDFTDNYNNIEDFIGDRSTRLAKFYDSQKGKQPSASRMASFLDKNPDISAEDVNAWFDKTNAYKAAYEEERKYKAERIKRAKEIKDLPWYKDVFTSDYSKQRYIDDPTTSVLGGSQFNPYSSEGQSELRDQILGASAGVADFIPGIGGVLLGPTIRTGRDAYHKYSDEKYKPEGSLLGNFGKDVAFNAGVEYLPTLAINKAKKLTGNIGKTARYVDEPIRSYNLAVEGKTIGDSHAYINDMLTKSTNNVDMWNAINSLPQSEYKADLLANVDRTKGNLAKQIKSVQDKWSVQLNPEVQQAYRTLRNDNADIMSNTKQSDYFLNKVYEPELTKFQKAIKAGYGTFNTVAPGAIKATGTPSIKVTDKDRTQIDWYKANYARDWELGFTPVYNETDPKWKAFEELYPERAMEIKYKELHK